MKTLKTLGLLAFLLALFVNSLAMAQKPSCREFLNIILTSFIPSEGIPEGKLTFASGRPLASWPVVEIEGFVQHPHIYREAITTLTEKMHDFDRHLSDLGFELPESTRFVIFDKKPLWPRAYTLIALRKPRWNWRKGWQMVVLISPPEFIGGPTSIMQEPSIFLHERTHSLLFRYYNPNTFVNLSQSIHEALADFFPAHQLDRPSYKIGDTSDVRNIEEKIFYQKNSTQLQHNFGINRYTDSIHYSNALWETRKALGAPTLSPLLKNFVDNLNLYRHSFITMKEKVGIKISRKRKRREAIIELEYFLAVLKRTVADAKTEEEIFKVDQVINKIAEELELRPKRINHIAENISKGENGIYNTKGITGNIIFASIEPLVSPVLDGIVLGGLGISILILLRALQLIISGLL